MERGESPVLVMSKLVEHMETVYQIECFICGETESAEWPTETKLDFAETLKKEGWETDDGGAMCKDCESNRKDYQPSPEQQPGN